MTPLPGTIQLRLQYNIKWMCEIDAAFYENSMTLGGHMSGQNLWLHVWTSLPRLIPCQTEFANQDTAEIHPM